MTSDSTNVDDQESQRLREDAECSRPWKLWGTYLSERQWGTVREDYSADGDVWKYFPHEHARSRAYRWGEDGLLGWCDRDCRLCFSVALWNGRDPILKERLFGLANPQGNHGEDVKELYYYLDALPTHSYCKALYKYPQQEFPYQQLIDENHKRTRYQPEYELPDTGIFNSNQYFDVFIEYAKAAPDDIYIRVTVTNRASNSAEIHLLPTLWFRNTWSWGAIEEETAIKPQLVRQDDVLHAMHDQLGNYFFSADPSMVKPEWLFTENETNTQRLFDVKNTQPFVKDAFHDAVIHGRGDAVNLAQTGTKAAVHYKMSVPAKGSVVLRLRLSADSAVIPFDRAFDSLFEQRHSEADAFYRQRVVVNADDARFHVARSAYAGMLWSKQFYHLVQSRWQKGDPTQIAPPPEHAQFNAEWQHLYAREVLSMPDKWEFPYFCSWDSAFHCVSLSQVDPLFAKFQLVMFLREWYMHRNGQLPAYEFKFSDVNPPVHAWAVWRVYRLPLESSERDVAFLERCFQKLLLNFTWWVNREDNNGNNLFTGGFLGLDNIGVFDRSKPMPMGGELEQVDGTGWMAFYCIHMLSMSLELARHDDVYEDIASKFLEHFGAITHAINHAGGNGLWDPVDGFYYDTLRFDDHREPLRIRSVVGFVPMFAATLIHRESVRQFSGFVRRAEWEAKYRHDMMDNVLELNNGQSQYLLTVPTREQLERMLARLFDEDEFLSPFGIRSLSKIHAEHPYIYKLEGRDYSVDYEPGEGTSNMFGGNSNWRGPVWFPINYLILESLRVYHRFYGENFRVEFPTRSGNWMTLGEAARNLSLRLQSLFIPDRNGRRPCHGDDSRYANDAAWCDLLLFNEYYHADTGRGCGASHQTGWTALVADLINLEKFWTKR
ncbi:MAG TPA: hypothetical protein VG962_07245 [Steroidobacteraceae bacterium]|nr:hypothetical protein [Steroidobacteraceae bacterium]